MKTEFFRIALCGILSIVFSSAAFAQTVDVPEVYEEMDDGAAAGSGWDGLDDCVYASWVSKDVHYKKRGVPTVRVKSDTVVYAWKGERVSAQAVLFSRHATNNLRLETGCWTGSDGATIDASCGRARFVNYVMTDGYQGCGYPPSGLEPFLVPDVIDADMPKSIQACTVRPVWVTLEVPRGADAGEYTLPLDVYDDVADTLVAALTLRVDINEHVLPLPADRSFDVDFWQQPYSVARYCGLEKWSDAHMEALRPYLKMLARAGQRVVTAILFYEPWGEQSNDKFDAMIATTLKSDGTWAYDYDVFDKYVELCAECGIDGQINCYSMVPWDMSFRYYDEAQGKEVCLAASTSSEEYSQLWIPFLRAFAEHLKEKGWYDKTCIAMDERGLDQMLDAYRVAQTAVPGIKMALAGNYHSELVELVYDYCLQFGQTFSEEELRMRRDKGFVSTTYVCCGNPAKPNIFTNNAPSDAAYLPVYALANGFDGFLHWSYMNWNDDPLRDSRWRMFAPGDTYCVYPGGRTSVRFERLTEGVQAVEKIGILRKEYSADGRVEELARLEELVAQFASGNVNQSSSAEIVNHLQSLLNGSPLPPAEEITDYCEAVGDAYGNMKYIRYLSSVTASGAMEDWTHTASCAGDNGYALAGQTLKVLPGTTFTLRAVAAENDDDIRYCRVALFADWNRDLTFDISGGERIELVGKANQGNSELLDYTFHISVPENATPGLTRLRLSYSDAWVAEPDACGEMVKGFVFDIPLEVVDASSGMAAVHDEALFRWEGEVLCTSCPVHVSVYDMAGILIDRPSCMLSSYDTGGFMPGIYIVVLTTADGGGSTFKFVRGSAR